MTSHTVLSFSAFNILVEPSLYQCSIWTSLFYLVVIQYMGSAVSYWPIKLMCSPTIHHTVLFYIFLPVGSSFSTVFINYPNSAIARSMVNSCNYFILLTRCIIFYIFLYVIFNYFPIKLFLYPFYCFINI